MANKSTTAVPSIERAIDEATKPVPEKAKAQVPDIAAPILPHLQWLANVAIDLERHTNPSQVAVFRRETERTIDGILGYVRSLTPKA